MHESSPTPAGGVLDDLLERIKNEDILAKPHVERLLLAAAVPYIQKGQNLHKNGAGAPLTTAQIAAAFNVKPWNVHEARNVLRGTPEEIEAVRGGKLSIHSVEALIMEGLDPQQRIERRAADPLTIGRNPGRIKNQKACAEAWQRVKQALDILTSLPLAAEIARYARGNSNVRADWERRGPRSIKYLEDFSHAFANPEGAADGGQDAQG